MGRVPVVNIMSEESAAEQLKIQVGICGARLPPRYQPPQSTDATAVKKINRTK
jgi:hypothetical protein